STAGGAVMVLESNPPGTIADLNPYYAFSAALPPTQLGGLEVLGLGQLRVDGSVLVNTSWGGVDESGNPAGRDSGPPYAASCTPLIPLTALLARDIRVVGGVDNPSNYGSFQSGQASPLKAGKLPVPDPYASLPAPTLSNDPAHVSATNYGGVQVSGLPLLGV